MGDGGGERHVGYLPGGETTEKRDGRETAASAAQAGGEERRGGGDPWEGGWEGGVPTLFNPFSPFSAQR